MGTIAEDQIAQSMPPRRGGCVALAVDATARPYDMTTLALGRAIAPDTGGKTRDNVVLWMAADGADIYFHFDSATSSGLALAPNVDAGGTLATGDTPGGVLRVGQPAQRFIIDRALDKFLIVKTAGDSATLRFWAGSSSTV